LREKNPSSRCVGLGKLYFLLIIKKISVRIATVRILLSFANFSKNDDFLINKLSLPIKQIKPSQTLSIQTDFYLF
jgi:hypothetical protein